MRRQPKTWRTWTVKELRRLEELRLAGLTAAEIATELGRTVPAVKCRLAAEDIPSGFRGLARREAWFAALNKPHTIAGVASNLGVTKGAVKRAKNRLRRLGFEIPDALRKGA